MAERECYVCCEGGRDVVSAGCRCEGRYIHRACLVRLLSELEVDGCCSVCRAPYSQVTRTLRDAPAPSAPRIPRAPCMYTIAMAFFVVGWISFLSVLIDATSCPYLPCPEQHTAHLVLVGGVAAASICASVITFGVAVRNEGRAVSSALDRAQPPRSTLVLEVAL